MSLEGNQNFPFIPFDNFDNLNYEEKIFLYGTSGSGKSRALFELIRNGVIGTQRILVINPRNSVGDESGRIPLRELIDKIHPTDIVVWDNFPDDLIRRDMANVKRVLDLLSSKYVKKLIVVLKPKYLEIFRELIKQSPEFFTQEITYDKELFKEIIRKYGENLPQFRILYERYISNNLEKISRILWNIEPIPLKVFDYYNELKNKTHDQSSSSDLVGIKVAETLLRSTNYYQHQFGLLSGMNERKNDAEFLYVLKMCYELGIERTESNISKLQHSIFESESPKEASNKLSSWLYVSGQDYAMHDVCRDAVKLSDYVKMKILTYISENFNSLIRTNSEQSLNLLGLFIGRNIEFVPLKNSSNGFLPDDIYFQMKKNVDLEKSIGLGVGEVFQVLDDDLRNILRNKCDTDIIFGMGMAEGLAQSFILLDSQQRKLVLEKIYSGFLFARFFGKTLGLLLKDLDSEIRNEILPHVESNSQFADGIGMGIGPVLDSVDEKLRKNVTDRAKHNIALTRGLGFALTTNIATLEKNQRQEVYSKTENNFQADVGLSFGLAEQYTSLPKEIQNEALNRCKDHNGFAKGFGLYLILFTLHKCPQEVLDNVDNNGELAYSLGFGYGWMLPYLPTEFQYWAKSKGLENNRFERGFGFGLGLILRHLPKSDENKHFVEGNTRSELDFGMGSGISFTWDCQSNEDKQAAYARCKSSSQFAQGIGYGHGYSFHYLLDTEKTETFEIAIENNQFANGLGYGLGWSFPYSDDKLRDKMFEFAKINNYFALGLGSGLGQLFRYFTKENRIKFFSESDKNGWFARGLGIGLGRYAMSYLEENLQDEVFLKSINNTEFALGLGEGLGREFKFFSDDFKRKIFDVYLPQSSFSAKGLGIGFGLSFPYLSQELHSEIYKRAKENVDFAIGLGEGLGMIFQYMNKNQRKEILDKVGDYSNEGFSRGLGTGLGKVLPFLTKDFQNELLYQFAMKSRQLSIGIGIGAGSTFTYLSEDITKSLLHLSDENQNFALGLGEGLGSIIFSSIKSDLRNKLFTISQKNPSLAKGLGIGIGIFFRYYETTPEYYQEIHSTLSSNPNVATGFGLGIGIVYSYLSENIQKEMFVLASQNSNFAKNFGFCLGHFLPTTKFEKTIKLSDTDISQIFEFEYGLGAGSGQNFPSFNVEEQGKILNKALTMKEFGSGFGSGLAKSFHYLDSILAKEILNQAVDDGAFSYRLGNGLGNSFLSVNEKFHKDLLEIVKTKNLFSKGFLDGIHPNLKYLDKDSLTQISNLLEKVNSSEINSDDSALIAGNKPSMYNLKNEFLFDYFLVAQPPSSSFKENRLQDSMSGKDEVLFFGERKKCCVSFIDMVDSTKVTSQLNEIQLSKYYSIFLNSMATIVDNFNGKIIKNVGDALLYYFPNTMGVELRPSKIREVLECGVTMIAAHSAINLRMQEEGLPPINFRISADYGIVEVAKSQSSKSDDLFGFTMSLCSKINRKAIQNGMIIGDELYKTAHALAEDYSFSSPEKIDLGLADRKEYFIYHVHKNPRNKILQPFKHKSN